MLFSITKYFLFRTLSNLGLWCLFFYISHVDSSNDLTKTYLSRPNTHPDSFNSLSLNEFISILWKYDINRFKPRTDFVLQIQNPNVYEMDTEDSGYDEKEMTVSQPFFKRVNLKKFNSLPTYTTFVKLLDNYIAPTGVKEDHDRYKEKEQNNFIDAVIATKCNRMVYYYVKANKLWEGELKDWKIFLKELWFQFYKRKIDGDSSAFEHIFVGETSQNRVLGLHNWIRFYLAEREGIVKYKAYWYPKPHFRQSYGKYPLPFAVQLKFSYHHHVKQIGSIFVGTSPEYELSLYTLLYLSGESKVRFKVRGVPCRVEVHSSGTHKKTIRTAYIGIDH